VEYLKSFQDLNHVVVLQNIIPMCPVKILICSLMCTNAGNLEKLANELAYATTNEEKEDHEEQAWNDRFVGLIAGVEVASTHQRLLMVLSNVGFCHSTLLPEQTRKYEHVWTYEG
jgi:hypothetical protein